MQIAVGGCLAQKDRDGVRERAPFVDVVFGTHNLAHAPDAVARRARRTARSSRSSTSTRRTRRRCRRGATSTTRRGSRSRSAATTRARSASCRRCGARRSAGAPATSSHEVEELARDGVRRDHAARSERQLLRPRPRRRAVPPAVRRSPAHARRGRRHRAHPLHLAAPEGSAAGDDRGDGRVRARVRAPAPAVAVGERRHAGAHAPRLHRRRAISSGCTRRAPPFPISRSRPTSSSASRARPRPTSCARSRSRPRPTTTRPTRSCSRPAPAPKRR